MAIFPLVVVSPIFSLLFSRVEAELRDEYKLRKDVRRSLSKLKQSLEMTRAVVERAEQQALPREAVIWISNLTDFLYSAHDILDHHSTAAALRSRAKSGREKRKICLHLSPLFFWQNLFFTGGGLARAIKEIQEDFDAIARDKAALDIHPPSDPAPRRTPTTSTPVGPLPVVGRDAEMKRVLDWLLQPSSTEHLSALCIAGIGGIGKTALAKLAFQDKKVNDEFEVKMWVCVTADFDVTRITKEMLQSAAAKDGRKETCDLLNLDAIQKLLLKEIEGKRFLLVLDDVWNENQIKWDSLLGFFRDHGVDGNKVIITARTTSIERNVKGEVISLDALPDDRITEIFDRCAFGNGEFPDRAQKEKLRDEIVKKRLKGSPLAAVMMGRLLGSHADLEYWRGIVRSEIWELEMEEEGDLFRVLYLSYQQLPPNLKPCFAYCSLFPKGHGFQKERLVWLWIAQCLVQEEGRLSLEVVGRKHFDELCDRLFFEFNPGSRTFHMHDLIHDLAWLASKIDSVRMLDESSDSLDDFMKKRHVSFLGKNLTLDKYKAFSRYENLRTVIFHHGFHPKDDWSGIFNLWCKKLKNLRVLGLRECSLEKLPDSVGNLKLLRYLDLSSNPIKYLPKNMCNLYNLQVLDLENCNSLQELCSGITKLVNLRHLRVSPRYLHDLPKIGELTSIQKLEVFKVGKAQGHKISELENLNMLHEELRIESLENVESKEEATKSKLDQKENLEELALEWSHNTEASAQGDGANQLLDCLRPHANLKRLIIKCSPGTRFPSWMMDNTLLPYLEIVRIRKCRKWEALPPLCCWQHLKVLEITGISLTHIDELFHRNGGIESFPSLEELDLRDMVEWLKWDDEDMSLLPRLQKLHIEDCPRLLRIPHLLQTPKQLYIRNVGVRNLPEIRNPTILPASSSSSSSSSRPSSHSSLHIEMCPDLVSLNDGLLRSRLENVEKLRIADCKNLEQLPEEGLAQLVSLARLEIVNCAELKIHSLQQGCLPSSLVELKIINCSSILSLERKFLSHLTSLKVLSIARCESLAAVEIHDLAVVESLSLVGCPMVTALPQEMLGSLNSLKKLMLLDCEGLASVGLEALTSLELLSLSNCPKLVINSSPEFLPQLKYLTVRKSNPQFIKSILLHFSHAHPHLLRLIIFECPDLTSFDKELEEALLRLTSLRELFINRCPALQCLPPDLRGLSSLSILSIKNCSKMQELPDTGLPNSLEHLWVTGCPSLEARYSKERGPDWRKISHIRDVVVGVFGS